MTGNSKRLSNCPNLRCAIPIYEVYWYIPFHSVFGYSILILLHFWLRIGYLWGQRGGLLQNTLPGMCVCVYHNSQHNTHNPEWRWSKVHYYQLLLEWTRVIYLANGGLSKLTEFITVEFGPPARGCPGGPITCGCGAGGPGNEHVFPVTQF